MTWANPEILVCHAAGKAITRESVITPEPFCHVAVARCGLRTVRPVRWSRIGAVGVLA
ncbi:hypothetical protein GCM10027161_04080 [Microbispora hainanensis]